MDCLGGIRREGFLGQLGRNKTGQILGEDHNNVNGFAHMYKFPCLPFITSRENLLTYTTCGSPTHK